MNDTPTAIRRKLPKWPSRAAQSSIESIERRTLLSAAWSTTDSFVYPAGGPGTGVDQAIALAADSAGGVYAVGEGHDGATNQEFAVVRHKDAVSGAWSTVAVVPGTPGSNLRTDFNAVAVDPAGVVYLAGQVDGFNAKVWKGTLSADGTSLSLSVVDTPSLGTFRYVTGLAMDSAQNVFEVGYYSAKQGNGSIQHWFVRKQTGEQGTFATVDDYLYNSADARAWGVAAAPGGEVYVTGVGGGGPHGSNLGANWIVRKSTNGGSTWSTVDTFELDPSTGAPARARAITVGGDGTLRVVGAVSTRVRTGGTDHKPTYGYTQRWYMRSSGNGGANWSNDDVFPQNTAPLYLGNAYELDFDPATVMSDPSGNVYVAGPGGSNSLGVVRTNAVGSWATSDSFPGTANCLTRDSAGDLYVGGYDGGRQWTVRSLPTAPTNLTAAAVSSSQINLSWTNAAGSDQSGFAVYRSTDGVTFSLLGTVDASVTSYNDGGLTAGTTYFYYVVTLLNSDGVSAPSGTVSATTGA